LHVAVNKTAIPRGQERFVLVSGSAKGCIWNGIYQFEGTVYWKENAVVLGMEEWSKLNNVTKLEMVKGQRLLRSTSWLRAATDGRVIATKLGDRWAIPLSSWMEYPA
jgi:hypothetical protein